MAAAGQLRPDDMVLREGQEKWARAATVRGLFSEGGVPVAAPAGTAAAPRPPARGGVPWLLAGAAAVVLLAAGWLVLSRLHVTGLSFLLALALAVQLVFATVTEARRANRKEATSQR